MRLGSDEENSNILMFTWAKFWQGANFWYLRINVVFCISNSASTWKCKVSDVFQRNTYFWQFKVTFDEHFIDFVSPWSGFKVNEWERISFLWFSPPIYISACISRLYDITRWIYQAVQMSVAIEVVVLGRSKQWGARTKFEEIWEMRS